MKKLSLVILSITVILGCSTFDPLGLYDEQFVQIEFKDGWLDILNTFEGFIQKDLVMDGTIKVTFRLTEDEQTSIINTVKEAQFFNFPDTLHSQEGVRIAPDPGIQKLRIKYGTQEKTVIWTYPLNPESEFTVPLKKLIDKIRVVINANPNYQKLPPARGAYG